MGKKVLVVDDEKLIVKGIRFSLEQDGMEVDVAYDGGEALEKIKNNTYDMVLLDIMLPEEDGLSVLQKLRANPETRDLPVIMLTAKSTEYDKVIGLDSGADDYVTKPFGTMELVARVKALLRRAEPPAEGREYSIGPLFLSPDKHIIQVEGNDVVLTLKEFQLLCFLVKNQGNVMTRDRILQEIWGYEFDGENRTVDVHIRTLRAKLGKAGDLIETVRGIGYRIGGKR